jgi:hypothetical protein
MIRKDQAEIIVHAVRKTVEDMPEGTGWITILFDANDQSMSIMSDDSVDVPVVLQAALENLQGEPDVERIYPYDKDSSN